MQSAVTIDLLNLEIGIETMRVMHAKAATEQIEAFVCREKRKTDTIVSAAYDTPDSYIPKLLHVAVATDPTAGAPPVMRGNR